MKPLTGRRPQELKEFLRYKGHSSTGWVEVQTGSRFGQGLGQKYRQGQGPGQVEVGSRSRGVKV